MGQYNRAKQSVEQKNKDALASSMSRIYRQFHGDGASSFGSLSAFRNLSEEADLENTKELASDLQEMGYGFVPIIGQWKSDETGQTYTERSFWIPTISKEDINSLSIKYQQEAYIWGSNGEWFLYDTGTTENPLDSGSTFTFNVDEQVDEVWSKYYQHKWKYTKRLSMG